MHDKPQPAPAQEFRLSDHGLLAIRGRDAIAFSQSQFMNDVAALADGQWQWNGWLNAKGRVIALFALLRLDAETLWLLLPDADAGTLATQLQRYVFRSKLSLDVVAATITGRFAAPDKASGARMAIGPDREVQLDMGGAGGPRCLAIHSHAATEDVDALARWTTQDLLHGLPRLPAAQAEQWTPQQLSLERLHAFSVKKGCYPGQEIVARTHFLGQARRGLAMLEADVPLHAGGEVQIDGRTAGTLIASAGVLALAVLPLERPAGALMADASTLRERPLQAGLDR